ncbi:hypothetical protein FRB94_013803 [Tulasnella sp. JGI-2019a]|nr:hypothetical protein FRB94_013803 [Tulasnella sp. JGI-2019a]
MEDPSKDPCDDFLTQPHVEGLPQVPSPTPPPAPTTGAYPPYTTQFEVRAEDMFLRHLAERGARMAAAQPPNYPPQVQNPTIQDHSPTSNYVRRVRFGDPAAHTRDTFMRTDRKVRTTALDLITSVMMNPNVDVTSAVVTLEDVMDQCRDAGVPFSELLEVEVEGYDMVPLMIEIIRCDFEGAPDLLLFLLQHTASARKFQWFIRRACMLRNDDLFEKLRQITPHPDTPEPWNAPHFEYIVSMDQYATPLTRVASSPNTFRALISIPHFLTALDENARALECRRRQGFSEKRSLRTSEDLKGFESNHRQTDTNKRPPPGSQLANAEPGLICEIVALGRSWTFEVGANRLILTLVDGVECNVDASATVIEDELSTTSTELHDDGMGGDLECPTTPTITMTRVDPTSSHASSLVEQSDTSMSELEFDLAPEATDEDFDLCQEEASTRSASPDLTTEAIVSLPEAPTPADPLTSEKEENEPRGERLNTTYVELIKWAILASPNKKATVQEICDMIRKEFPFYAHAEGFALVKAGVRQRISTSDQFQLLDEGPIDSTDKGGYWIYTGQDEGGSTDLALDPSSLEEHQQSTMRPNPVPTPPTPFVFPQATLYPRHSSTSKNHVAITQCYSAESKPSNLIGAALKSGHLLLQLIVRLHDELDIINADPSVAMSKPESSLAATDGMTTATSLGAKGYRSRAASSAGGWSIVDDDEAFDSDGEISYVEKDSDLGDAIADDESVFSEW